VSRPAIRQLMQTFYADAGLRRLLLRQTSVGAALTVSRRGPRGHAMFSIDEHSADVIEMEM
jgi:hypothetical protein